MDEETFEFAKKNDLSFEEAEELQTLTDEAKLDTTEKELSKEDIDELVKVFSLLLKWDREQNPENYRRKQDYDKINAG